MPRYNFGEFLGFSPKGLKPFKIQTKFKTKFFPEFLIQNPFEFEVGPKKKSVYLDPICHLRIFHEFWRLGMTSFRILKFRCWKIV
jgi:hypothetical protein